MFRYWSLEYVNLNLRNSKHFHFQVELNFKPFQNIQQAAGVLECFLSLKDWWMPSDEWKPCEGSWYSDLGIREGWGCLSGFLKLQASSNLHEGLSRLVMWYSSDGVSPSASQSGCSSAAPQGFRHTLILSYEIQSLNFRRIFQACFHGHNKYLPERCQAMTDFTV